MLVTSVNVDLRNVLIEFSKVWVAGNRVTLTVKQHDA